MFKRQSALAGMGFAGGRDGTDGQRRLRLGESRDWTLTQIAAFPGTESAFAAAVQQRILGCVLPHRMGEIQMANTARVFMTGLSQFWILMRGAESLTPDLHRAITADIGAVTPLSHSRTAFFIEGVAARQVLATAITLDLHPEVFCVGHFAFTGWHHTPVLLDRVGEDRYELYALRTFAQWVWESMIDAALPFGYDLVGDSGP